MTAIAALGVGLAGLAGVLLAPIAGVHPAMGAEILTAAFVVVVIGGLGSFWGVIAAALLVGVVRGVTIYFNPSWGEASMYLLMALVLLLRPRAACSASGSSSNRCEQAPLVVAALSLALLPFVLDVGLPLRSAVDVVVFAIACMGPIFSSAIPGSFRSARRLVRARRLRGRAEPARLVSRRHHPADAVCDPVRFGRGGVAGRADSAPSRSSLRLLTLALTALLFAIAYRWTELTGGESGLGGVTRSRVLGRPRT